MTKIDTARRQFLAYFSAAGLTSTLLPGVLWAQVQEGGKLKLTKEMLNEALRVAGLNLTEEDKDAMMDGVNQNLARYETFRKIKIKRDPACALCGPQATIKDLSRAV